MWDSIRLVGCAEGVVMTLVNLSEEGIVEISYGDFGHSVIHIGQQLTLPKGSNMIQLNCKKFIGKEYNMWMRVVDTSRTYIRNECSLRVDKLHHLVGTTIMPERVVRMG